VPKVIALHEDDALASLTLEWLDLRPLAGAGALGRALAALHVAPVPGEPSTGARASASADATPRRWRYGWHRDNFIGPTPQLNAWHEHWPTFWRERRLAPQLALAARNGHGGPLQRAGERLLASVDTLLAGHAPAPSLLHGDLWSGNAGLLPDGTPVVFDPAVYVGDRECDLAMTELFGGFDADFHAAYRDALPLDHGYRVRRELYNLYHLLNHLNLFGQAYRAQCERTIALLLAEVR
jgi:fructosamine-3-kinase